MGNKVIRLTEADLEKLVMRVLESETNEQIDMGFSKSRNIDRAITTEDSFYKTIVEKRIPTLESKIDKAVEDGYTVDESVNDLNKALASINLFGIQKDRDNRVVSLVAKNGYDTAMKAYSKLQEFMDDTSKQVMNGSKTENPAFYAYAIRKSTTLLNTLKGTKKKTRSVIANNVETQQEETPKKVEMPMVQYSDADIPLDTKFASGSPELKEGYSQSFSESFSDALKAFRNEMIKNNKQEGVSFPRKYYIKDVTIVSSSSKVPHSKLPKPYYTDPNDPNDTEGFLRLSEDRAKSMMNLVQQYIKDNSDFIITDSNTTTSIDAKGKNGDGTSGPEWDKSKGSQHKDYMDAQMAKVLITFTVTPKLTPITPEPKIVQSNGYSLEVSGTTRRKFRFKWNFKLPTIRLRGGSRIIPASPDLCPAF